MKSAVLGSWNVKTWKELKKTSLDSWELQKNCQGWAHLQWSSVYWLYQKDILCKNFFWIDDLNQKFQKINTAFAADTQKDKNEQ